MHLSHIPRCTIQNRNVHISVLNCALWDMGQVQCGICDTGLFVRWTAVYWVTKSELLLDSAYLTLSARFNSSDHAGDGIFWLWVSIPCLRMPWLLKSPRHHQGWHWQYWTGNISDCSFVNMAFFCWTKSKICIVRMRHDNVCLHFMSKCHCCTVVPRRHTYFNDRSTLLHPKSKIWYEMWIHL